MAELFTTSSGEEVLWNLDPKECFRVIKGSALLPWSMKGLWMEDHLLSRQYPARGSWLIAEKMAFRLRLANSTVEQMRRAFLSLGLYLKKKGDGRGDGWMPCLPVACVAPSGTMTDEAFREYADRLDVHLRRRAELLPSSFFYVLDFLSLTHGKPRDRPTGSHGADPPEPTGQTDGKPRDRRAHRRSLVSQEGGLGGVPSQQVLKEPSLLTDPNNREGTSLTRGERREEGRDGGSGEGRGDSDPAVISAAMTKLRQTLDQGGA